MKRYLIIADDITGSNDTGVQLKRRGIDTVVTLNVNAVQAQPTSYVLDTESRPLKGDEAYNLLFKAASQINLQQFDYVIKKVDSTLRGPIAWEIAAIDQVYAPKLIIFMPALPDLGRTTIDGIHLLHNTPITQTELANDPRTPVKQDNLRKLLEEVYHEPVTHINLAAIENELPYFSVGRVFSFDAVTNKHIQMVISAAGKTGKRVLWVGTAGLVDNLLELIEPHLPAVALVASLSETTRAQVRYAQEKGAEVVVVPNSFLIKKEIVDKTVELLQSGRDVIVISEASYDRAAFDRAAIGINETSGKQFSEAGVGDRMERFSEAGVYEVSGDRKEQFSGAGVHEVSDDRMERFFGASMTTDEASRMVQKLMGEIMANILEHTRVSGIFLTGGDTAMGFLKAINATELRIVSEVLIGIPLMRIVGGKLDNLKVITKAGAFGQKDALSFCLRKLKEKDDFALQPIRRG